MPGYQGQPRRRYARIKYSDFRARLVGFEMIERVSEAMKRNVYRTVLTFVARGELLFPVFSILVMIALGQNVDQGVSTTGLGQQDPCLT